MAGLQAGLILEESRREAVMHVLLNLPEPLRPTRYNFGEDERRRPIPSRDPLSTLIDRRQPGPLLYGPGVAYDVGSGWDRTTRVACHFEAPEPDLRTLLSCLAAAGPLYGYGCSVAERIARNRVAKSFGINNLEGWVGRHPGRQLPGLYWYTLISHALLQRLEIPLGPLVAMAKEYDEPASGQHLFRFYDRLEDWQTASEVNRFIVDEPGIFNIEEVKPHLDRVDTFLEITSLLARWP